MNTQASLFDADQDQRETKAPGAILSKHLSSMMGDARSATRADTRRFATVLVTSALIAATQWAAADRLNLDRKDPLHNHGEYERRLERVAVFTLCSVK